MTNINNGISDKEYCYIEKKICELDGIGKATAGRIIAKFDNFKQFKTITLDGLISFDFLKNNYAQLVYDKFFEIDFDEDIMILEIDDVISDFIKHTYENIEDLELEAMDINPFLTRALKFDEAEEIIIFYLYQRITRSIVTSWGITVEKLVLAAGAEKIPKKENVSDNGKKFDLRKKIDDITYYIQVKSGPNTMNVGMVESLNEIIEDIEEIDENNRGILGMTYGKRDLISVFIRDTLNDIDEKTKIGKEFWDFIGERRGFTEELLDLISDSSRKYEEMYGGNQLSEFIDLKKEKLLQDWVELYGGVGLESISNAEDRNL